jgi:hypothetical protein
MRAQSGRRLSVPVLAHVSESASRPVHPAFALSDAIAASFYSEIGSGILAGFNATSLLSFVVYHRPTRST